MNRIRKYNSKYQVLVTPHQKYNVGFEFMVGSWTDEGLMGFRVNEYDNYQDAECEALNHPDINWERLVEFHKDNYLFLKKELSDLIKYTGIAVDFTSHLMSPIETKDKMFDRVLKGQNSEDNEFRLIYNMNDIISFEIVNPWTHNLEEMEGHLTKQSRLNIFRKIEKNGVMHLVGRTDIGTTYDIVLCPSVVHNWMKWRTINYNISQKRLVKSLENVLSLQNNIDKFPRLR